MSEGSFGHPTDRLAPAQRIGRQFDDVIATLTGGGLMFPPPFDLTSAAALCRNGGRGADAVRCFVESRGAVPQQYRLQLHQVVPGTEMEPREILDTTQSDLLQILAIVQGLVEEMLAQAKENNGGP